MDADGITLGSSIQGGQIKGETSFNFCKGTQQRFDFCFGRKGYKRYKDRHTISVHRRVRITCQPDLRCRKGFRIYCDLR